MSDQAQKSSEPSGFRLAGTMAFAGLVAGVILVLAYDLTLPIIERNNAKALREAVKTVVPGSTKMQKLVAKDGKLVPVPETDKAPGIFAAYDDQGAFKGYALPAEGAGFQDVIKLIYGFDPEKKALTGMFVLDSRETPGLGDKIFKDLEFVNGFQGVVPQPQIVAVKKGSKANPNEIDAITGATISSKAVVKIINGSNETWLGTLPAAAPAIEVSQK